MISQHQFHSRLEKWKFLHSSWKVKILGYLTTRSSFNFFGENSDSKTWNPSTLRLESVNESSPNRSCQKNSEHKNVLSIAVFKLWRRKQTVFFLSVNWHDGTHKAILQLWRKRTGNKATSVSWFKCLQLVSLKKHCTFCRVISLVQN